MPVHGEVSRKAVRGTFEGSIELYYVDKERYPLRNAVSLHGDILNSETYARIRADFLLIDGFIVQKNR